MSEEESVETEDSSESKVDSSEQDIISSGEDIVQNHKTDFESVRRKEEILLQLDEKFLTGGIRLSIALPSFAFFLFFMAWSYSSSSPSWWVDNIQESLNTDFWFILLTLSFIVVLGQLAVVITHRLRCVISRNSLDERIVEYSENNKSTTSLHGYHSLKSGVEYSILLHNTTVSLTLFSLIGILLTLIFGLQSTLGLILFGLSVSLLILAEGQHIVSRNYPYNSVKRTGLLDGFQPPIHPSTMDNVFYDFIASHIDPFLRTEVEDFFVEILEFSKRGKKPLQVREMVLLVLYRQSTGWGEKEARIELNKILTKQGVELFFNHSIFDMDVWTDIFAKAKRESPAFYRLLNRLLHDLEMANSPSIPDLIFEVDMENVVSGSSSLFSIMYNLTNEEKVVILRIQSPDFRPQDLSLKYRLPPGDSAVWPEFISRGSEEEGSDSLNRLYSIIDGGVTTWNTLLANARGEGTLSIRLEDENGSLLVGKQINVRVRPNFSKRLKNVVAFSMNTIGGAGILLSVLMLISRLMS